MNENLPEDRSDPWRLAAVLLYARGETSPAYAEARRAEAVAQSDWKAAEFWSAVETAIMTLLPQTPRNRAKLH